MASLWKACVHLFYSQVGRDKPSLQELNKGTLVYSQAEWAGSSRQDCKCNYNNKSKKSKSKKQFPTWSQNRLPSCNHLTASLRAPPSPTSSDITFCLGPSLGLHTWVQVIMGLGCRLSGASCHSGVNSQESTILRPFWTPHDQCLLPQPPCHSYAIPIFSFPLFRALVIM